MLKESFIAPTPKEAYELAVKKYGSIDCFKIVAAKQYSRGDDLVSEIIIEVEEEVYYNSSGIDEEEALILEMNSLKKKMAKMKQALMPEKRGGLAIDEVKESLIKRGLQEKWVDSMLNPFIGTQVAEDKELLLSFILEEIEESIIISKEPIESRIILFIGATGVGKTTTIAKIAKFSMDRGIPPNEIAFLNLDNFKIGAFEQLNFLAKSMSITHYKPNNPEEFYKYLYKLRDKSLILIDTAGASPSEMDKIIKTIKFSKTIEGLSSYLVVSTTSKYEDLIEVYNGFSFLNLKSVVITKVDETKTIGNIIAFLLDTKLPVSFISTGQDIQNDLEIATKRKILDVFISELKN